MARYARIIDDVVVEIVDLPDDVLLSGVFSPDLGFEPVAGSVDAGMIRVGDGFVVAPLPAAPPEPSPVAKLAAFLAANPDVAALISI